MAAFILLANQAAAFTDTECIDFNQGAYNQTVCPGAAVGLDIMPNTTRFFLAGNYTSNIKDASLVVKWTQITWRTQLDGGSITFHTRRSNDNVIWTEWSAPYTSSPITLDQPGRFFQYRADFTSPTNTSSPYLIDVSGAYIITKPEVNITGPPDGHASTTDSADLSCSATSLNPLSNMSFYSNVTGAWRLDETVPLSGTSDSAELPLSNLTNNTDIIWNCLVWDSAGQSMWGGNRTLLVRLADTVKPVLTYGIEPKVIAPGGRVSITADATDDKAVDRVWAMITLPDNTTQRIELVNNGTVDYTSSITGTYGITLHANDSSGNEAQSSDSFMVSELVRFNATVRDSAGSGLTSTLQVFYPGTGTIVGSFTSSTGSFENEQLIKGVFDFRFSAYGGDFALILKSINVSHNLDNEAGLDRPPAAPGFALTYAANSSYLAPAASAVIRYSDTDFPENASLSLQKCSLWDFENRICLGAWEPVASVHNATSRTLEVTIGTFPAAFSVKAEAYCGDSICSSGETSLTCPDDCVCTPGETRQCGTSDVGRCAFGTQTCVDGNWGACEGSVEPIIELCNEIDDDCDGTVDDVDEGTTPLEARCACFGGEAPSPETCNNIDDDCNSQVDENLQRKCGTDVGICEFGVTTCESGEWSTECVGAVEPKPVDICFNGLDDNCDGMVDDGCPDCNNGIMDGDEEGVDCGGSCPAECSVFALPMDYITYLVIVIILAAAGYLFYTRRMAGKKDEWGELQERYGGKKPEKKPDEWEELEKKYKK
jgi:hypothetical protein